MPVTAASSGVNLSRELGRAWARVDGLVKANRVLVEQEKMVTETNVKLRDRALLAERKLAAAQKQILALETRLTVLETQVLALHKTSTNSSKPPSSDDLGEQKKRTYPSREKTGKKTGGQKGHKGISSQRLEPTGLIVYEPEGLCGCGKPAADGVALEQKIRQLVSVQVDVTAVDHVTIVRKCECSKVHCGEIPEGVFEEGSTNPVVFDLPVKALAVGLAECGQVPVKAACGWIEGMLGIYIGEATVRSWIAGLAANLDVWDKHVVELLRKSPVVGADETPIRVEGHRNAHAHVAVTGTITRMHFGGRSKKDIIAGGVLENYQGTLVSDGLTAYRSIGAKSFQACLAHLLRYLRFADEMFTPHDSKTEHPYPQLRKLGGLFSEAIKVTRESSTPPGPDMWEEQVEALCIELEDSLGSVPKSKPVTDTLALTRRIRKYLVDGSLLAFTADLQIPPTNNAAEQAVRPLKVRQRRSGTRRSVPHTKAGLRIAGYLDTARKNGITPEEAIRLALQKQPYLPPN